MKNCYSRGNQCCLDRAEKAVLDLRWNDRKFLLNDYGEWLVVCFSIVVNYRAATCGGRCWRRPEAVRPTWPCSWGVRIQLNFLQRIRRIKWWTYADLVSYAKLFCEWVRISEHVGNTPQIVGSPEQHLNMPLSFAPLDATLWSTVMRSVNYLN